MIFMHIIPFKTVVSMESDYRDFLEHRKMCIVYVCTFLKAFKI